LEIKAIALHLSLSLLFSFNSFAAVPGEKGHVNEIDGNDKFDKYFLEILIIYSTNKRTIYENREETVTFTLDL